MWIRHFVGGPISCEGTVVNIWIDTLSTDAIVTIRLSDGAIISIPLTHQRLMWDFAAD